jgi:hypothetical protein
MSFCRGKEAGSRCGTSSKPLIEPLLRESGTHKTIEAGRRKAPGVRGRRTAKKSSHARTSGNKLRHLKNFDLYGFFPDVRDPLPFCFLARRVIHSNWELTGARAVSRGNIIRTGHRIFHLALHLFSPFFCIDLERHSHAIARVMLLPDLQRDRGAQTMGACVSTTVGRVCPFFCVERRGLVRIPEQRQLGLVFACTWEAPGKGERRFCKQSCSSFGTWYR